MELVSPASPAAPRQEVMMVTTDDYSYKPGLAAAAPPPSFQQHHPPPLQLHGGGDHDKVRLPPAPSLCLAGWPSSFPVTVASSGAHPLSCRRLSYGPQPASHEIPSPSTTHQSLLFRILLAVTSLKKPVLKILRYSLYVTRRCSLVSHQRRGSARTARTAPLCCCLLVLVYPAPNHFAA